MTHLRYLLLRITPLQPRSLRLIASRYARQTPILQRSCSSTIDHRQLAASQKLIASSIYSPGSPMFLPNGAEMMNKLMACLRAHYPQFGFREVITPQLYKTKLWKISGHWDNYAEDMFQVSGTKDKDSDDAKSNESDVDYALKPMNCPGHCLLFANEVRSYRDLPIRYADFSPLHRNEVSGALTGLTRVRRFHQDDGHIFCRPSQIESEITRTMDFIKLFYSDIFGFGDFRLVLSTRPEDHFIGELEDWNEAEDQLRSALEATGQPWSVGEGDGAFYGPKIDIILRDGNGNEHQTATIQLDFQLPKRFDLKYEAPISENSSVMAIERPVLIHRAVAGSLERFLALLIERYNGVYPFWFSPFPVTILSVSQTEQEMEYIQRLASQINGTNESMTEKATMVPIGRTPIHVETDISAKSLGKKIALAKQKGFNFYVVIGPKDVQNGTCSLSIGDQKNLDETRDELADVLDVERALLKDKGAVEMNGPILRSFFWRLQDKYL